MFTKLAILHVSQLLNIIPDSLYRQLSEETGVDFSVQAFRGQVFFELLLVGILRSDRLSTRLLEMFYNSPLFGCYSSKNKGHTTRHSSIADRLQKINPDFFKKLFEAIYERFYDKIHANKKVKNLVRYDSTMIKISSALVEWGMKVGAIPKDSPRQHQLKITLGMKGDFAQRMNIHHEQKFLSEQTALADIIINNSHNKKDIVSFDLGLTRRSSLQDIDNQGVKFVTRGGANLRYKVQETKGELPDDQNGLRFIQDSKVYLYTSGDKVFEHEFRLIEAEVIQSGETLYFLTNIEDLDAAQIAEIYRHRWDIEVFFRFLKQELNVKHLLSHSLNGIEVQMYVSLIAALLLTVYKETNNLKGYKLVKMQFEEHLLVHLASRLAKAKEETAKLEPDGQLSVTSAVRQQNSVHS